MNVTRGVFTRVRVANWRAIAVRPRVHRDVLGMPINASEQQRFFVSTSFFDGWKNRIKTAFGLDNPEVFSDKQGNFFAESKEKNLNNDYKNRIHGAKGINATRRLFAEMKEKNIEMNAGTYNLMIRVVGEVGRDVDGARRLFAEMKEKNIKMNAGTYNLMIHQVGQIDGDVDGARLLFAEMKEKNIKMNSETDYSEIIRLVGEVDGDVNGARR